MPNEATQGLWYPRRRAPKLAVRSRLRLAPAKSLQVLVKADVDRHAQHAVIAFPDVGFGYVVETSSQLRAIIEKLQRVHNQIEGRGEGQVVNFHNRSDWNVDDEKECIPW